MLIYSQFFEAFANNKKKFKEKLFEVGFCLLKKKKLFMTCYDFHDSKNQRDFKAFRRNTI